MYPNLIKLLSDRFRLVYGSPASFARMAGMSRQTLHERMMQAERSRRTHPWFETVLCLPEGTLERPTPEALDATVTQQDIATALLMEQAVWKIRWGAK